MRTRRPVPTHPSDAVSVVCPSGAVATCSWREKQITWDAADRECVRHGGRLASLNTPDDWNQVVKLMGHFFLRRFKFFHWSACGFKGQAVSVSTATLSVTLSICLPVCVGGWVGGGGLCMHGVCVCVCVCVCVSLSLSLSLSLSIYIYIYMGGGGGTRAYLSTYGTRRIEYDLSKQDLLESLVSRYKLCGIRPPTSVINPPTLATCTKIQTQDRGSEVSQKACLAQRQSTRVS